MRRIVPLLGLLAAASLVASCAGAPLKQARVPERKTPYDHAGAISAFEGAKTCTACHDSAAKEVVTSLHWQQVGAAPNVIGMPAGFQAGMMVSF
jgi:hypothetical protein